MNQEKIAAVPKQPGKMRLLAGGCIGVPTEDHAVLMACQYLSNAAEFARRAHVHGDYDPEHLECIDEAFSESVQLTSEDYVLGFLTRNPEIRKHFEMSNLLPVRFGGDPAIYGCPCGCCMPDQA